MSRNAYRDDNDTGQPDAYWRRRVITLCAGLTLLGLLAWAFAGGGKPASPGAQGRPGQRRPARRGLQRRPGPTRSRRRRVALRLGGLWGARARRRRPGQQGRHPRNRQASSAAGSAASLPFPTVSPTGSTQPGKGSSASGRAAARADRASTLPPGGVEPGGGCAPGSVVLGLFTSRTYYRAGQYPVFDLYAVSTASGACSFDVSPARLHLLVMSSGRVIWDSADCTRGEPNRVAQLRRGVPARGSVTWNRTISLPGCVTVASSVRPGSYQVQARDGSVASPVRTFKLGG